MKPNRIVVLGGSGFVGRHLVSVLASRGYEVTIVTRARERAKWSFLLPRVATREADVRDPTALSAVSRGADALVNLVGTLHERSGATFDDVHDGVTDAAIRACRANRIDRLLQMSSLNADPQGPSAYLRSKGKAEARVVASGLNWTIFQPSVLFGPEDRFLNLFASIARLMPVVFLAGANARFQPVYVGDVVAAMTTALTDDVTIGQRYPLCGPKAYTLRQLVAFAASQVGERPLIVGLPNSLGRLQALVMEHLPGKLLTRDNLDSMKVDSTCDSPYPVVFGGRSHAMEVIVPNYLSTTARDGPFSIYRRRQR